MIHKLLTTSFTASLLFSATMVFAQDFGEYGRMLGGMPRGQGVAGPLAPREMAKPRALPNTVVEHGAR